MPSTALGHSLPIGPSCRIQKFTLNLPLHTSCFHPTKHSKVSPRIKFQWILSWICGVQKTMTVERCLKKENNKAFSIEAIISNCLPKPFAENNRQVTKLYPFPNCQNYPNPRTWPGASFFPSPNRIHSNLYQTNEC